MNLTADLMWLKTHLILLLIVCGLIFGGVYGVEFLVAKHDAAEATKYQQILRLQEQQNTQLATQLASDEKNWQQIYVQLTEANTKLSTEINQRNTALVSVIKQNASLTAQDAASQITQLTEAKATEVTASGNSVILDLPISRVVVSNLDSLAVVQKDLTDTQSQLTNETKLLSDATVNITEQKTVIGGLQTTIVDQDRSCKAEVASVKASARKSKFKWFISGVVVGFVGEKLLKW